MHLSEVTLLAFVHGELASRAKAEVEAHLAECSVCASAVSEQLADDARVGRLLAALDYPVPRLAPPVAADRGLRLRRVAVAASVALLVAGAAAAAVPGTTIHRWIHDRLGALGLVESRAPAPVPAHSLPSDDQAAGGVEVPAGRGLTVTFEKPEEGGILTITAADRPDVSLRAFGGAVAYQIGEGRIVVDNRRPAGRYALEVPGDLRQLTVRLGNRVVFDSERRPLGSSGRDTISLSTE